MPSTKPEFLDQFDDLSDALIDYARGYTDEVPAVVRQAAQDSPAIAEVLSHMDAVRAGEKRLSLGTLLGFIKLIIAILEKVAK